MTRKEKFGITWWGEQWLKALSQIDYANRLPRGRTYYNTGHVDSLTFHPDTLKVEALVAGSAYMPYEVTIALTPLPADDVTRLVDAIAERPRLVAKLLEGELDPEVGAIAESLGIALFPRSWREFRMRCTCPDSAVPCKHIAAVYYGMVRTIDTDPMWVFYCRGVDLPALLRDRGIDLDAADALEEPQLTDWLHWAEVDGGTTLTAERALRSLDDMSGVMTERLSLLAPETVEGAKHLTRNRLVRTIKGLQKSARTLEKSRGPFETHWRRFESRFQLGEGEPVLTDGPLGLELGLRTHAGKAVGLSPLDGERLLASLFATSPDGADAHSANLAFWTTLAYDALALIRTGGIAPVLVRTDREGSPVAHLVWVPALQFPVVEDMVAVSARRIADFGPDAMGDSALRDADATDMGRAILLLSTLITGFVRISDVMPQTMTNMPIVMAMTSPTTLFAYGLDQPSITRLRQFYRPFTLGLMSFVWTPVLTVRTGREGRVTLNLGILPRHATKETRPTLYRDILTSEALSADRFAIVSLFEALCAYCGPLSGILASKGKPASIELKGLRDFLFEAVPTLEMLGVRVMLPKRLQTLLKPRLDVTMTGGAGGVAQGMISAESLGRFDWHVAIGDRMLTDEEFAELMTHVGDIVMYRDEFIYLDPEVIQRLKTQSDRLESAGYLDMMRAAMTGELGDIAVRVPDNLLARIEKLTGVDDLPPPVGLQASLRPYQQRGYAWLMKNLRLGLGSLIADDMGLGKTLQVIAALLALKEAGELEDQKVLAVVPATLLTNWVREVARFAPALTVSVYHGTSRSLPPMADRADVILTTYGTLRLDLETLSAEPWRLMVLDEAQAVKNVGAGTTRAARSMPVPQVIAMSGTPVENRLSEYWSILSIVQPGLFGTADEFREAYARPIEVEHDEGALAAFRRVTAPFMLRRLKTDRSIIADLPEKVVCDRYVDLLPEQAALYAKTVADIMDKLRGLDAEEAKTRRTGLVLKLITALKQICNSPSLYLDGHAKTPDSGKGNALLELIEECREAGRKAIIFTQYAAMGERLQDWLETMTGRRPDFLHGGVPVKGRARMVDTFQTKPEADILIISLKAGGTGLNLTAASVVIHYDLWWNPAVENQATDRAYRIGQRRDVLVYRFLAAGTFEERINEMLEKKRELADLAVSTGESWIGDLTSDELQGLFRLETPANG